MISAKPPFAGGIHAPDIILGNGVETLDMSAVGIHQKALTVDGEVPRPGVVGLIAVLNGQKTLAVDGHIQGISGVLDNSLFEVRLNGLKPVPVPIWMGSIPPVPDKEFADAPLDRVCEN